MEFTFANKWNHFEDGIFAILDEKKNELMKKGKEVFNLSVGTPDFKPDRHIIEALQAAAGDPENYKYALKDLPELIEAVVRYYEKRFAVSLMKDEIMALYGTQEGIAHIGLSLCNQNDIVLVPNPGYPIFEIGPLLAGANIYCYELIEEQGYLPQFDQIPEEIALKAKFMIVSYPLNPVCTTAPDSFYNELIAFAKKYNIIILHDNAYADIIFDGRIGKSFLSFEGAKEVGVEFYSLSKTFNMTGCRISFIVGNKEIISHFKTLRSQIDYGIFLPVQYAAIAALLGSNESVKKNCHEYERRRNALCNGLNAIGWPVKLSEGSMFVWAKLPSGFQSSKDFCMELMEKTGVIGTPGIAFGSLGEGYIRFALTLPVTKIEKAVKIMKESGIFKN